MSFFQQKERILVGININVNGIVEIINIDKYQRKVLKYAQKKAHYDFATREVVDYIELEACIKDLFEEIELNPKKCKIVLTLPNVFFGFSEVPETFTDEYVLGSLINEVEQIYLFRKNNPSISWFISDRKDKVNKRICYAAIQEASLNLIKDIFERIGGDLIAVENSYSSVIKALNYCNITEQEIILDKKWNILLINENCYTIFAFQGDKLLDFYEDPLPIKSFSENEIYHAISGVTSSNIENYPAETLFVISEINEISAEILATKIHFEGQIKCIDRNKYSNESFLDIDYNVLPNLIPLISLEVMGSGIYEYKTFNLKFNFLGIVDKKENVEFQITIGGTVFDLTPTNIKIILGIISCLLFLFFITTFFTIKSFSEKKSLEITTLQTEIANLKQQIGLTSQTTGFDLIPAVTKTNISNKNAILYFSYLNKNIPDNLWLEYFYADSKGSYGIFGKSKSSENIYSYYKNIKNSVDNSNISISKLQFVDDIYSKVGTGKYSLYSFELTNDNFKNIVQKRINELKQINNGTQNNENTNLFSPLDNFIPKEIISPVDQNSNTPPINNLENLTVIN